MVPQVVVVVVVRWAEMREGYMWPIKPWEDIIAAWLRIPSNARLTSISQLAIGIIDDTEAEKSLDAVLLLRM